LYDLTNAAYWWVPLWDPRDRPEAFAELDAGHRLAVFARAYGMDEHTRAGLIPLARRMVRRFHTTARAAAERDEAFLRMWERGAGERLVRAREWLDVQAPDLVAKLTEGTRT